MTDTIVSEWRERIAAAAAAKAPLAIRGGGTKDFYGQAIVGEVLDTRAYAGIVDYDPTELVMTARAGTPLDDIEAAMRAAGQMMAFEPPRFDARTPRPPRSAAASPPGSRARAARTRAPCATSCSACASSTAAART